MRLTALLFLCHLVLLKSAVQNLLLLFVICALLKLLLLLFKILAVLLSVQSVPVLLIFSKLLVGQLLLLNRMPFVQFLLLLLLLCPLLNLFDRLKGLFLLVCSFHFKPFLLHLVGQQALLVFLILVLEHMIANIPVVLFGNKSHFLLFKALLV